VDEHLVAAHRREAGPVGNAERMKAPIVRPGRGHRRREQCRAGAQAIDERRRTRGGCDLAALGDHRRLAREIRRVPRAAVGDVRATYRRSLDVSADESQRGSSAATPSSMSATNANAAARRAHRRDPGSSSRLLRDAVVETVAGERRAHRLFVEAHLGIRVLVLAVLPFGFDAR